MLLQPRSFAFLSDQLNDLARAPGVDVVTEGRIPYGSLGKLADPLASLLATLVAPLLRLGDVRVLVIFHPWQYPIAAALTRRRRHCELWYSVWDRYQEAFSENYYQNERLRARVARRHAQAGAAAALSFTVSEKLADLERQSGRTAVVVPLGADSFPSPDPVTTVVALSLGFHGKRVDWRLLSEVASTMPELVVLLVGRCDETLADADHGYQRCRTLPNIVWLGYRSDDEVARLVLSADVGILPFRVDAYNDAGLPHRILKYARLGRRTVSPPLAGVRTFERAVITVDGCAAWIEALRAEGGRRVAPDIELREWALSQTTEKLNDPLWRRLEDLGIPRPVS